MSGYRYLVETNGPSENRRHYDGTDAGAAVAAWSKAVSEGERYVTLEAVLATGTAPTAAEKG